MPSGIYKRTKECIEKNRLAHLGKKHTEATKEKMRKAHLGKGCPCTEATKKKLRQAHLGKKQSKEHIEKGRLSRLGKKRTEATKEKMRQAQLGKKSTSWKGNNAGFSAIHKWVSRSKGKASLHKCIDCGEQAEHWSNVDHSYKRNLEDYKPRCIGCHRKYDKKYNLIIKKERK